MKKMTKLVGIIVLVAVIGFTMTACGGGGGGGGTPPSDPPVWTFSKSGTFGTNGKVDLGTSYSRSVRAVTANSYVFSGIVEDGAICLTLTGSYDPVLKGFTASAASASARYIFWGDNAGEFKALSVNPTTGVATQYNVTPAAVTITATPAESVTANKMPDKAMGWWKCDNYYGSGKAGSAIVSSFSYVLYEPNEDPMTVGVVEVSGSGNTYDLIISWYNGTTTLFQKGRAVFSSNDTKLSMYTYLDGSGDEIFNTLAGAKAATNLYEDMWLEFHR